jgi:hypothetical protein
MMIDNIQDEYEPSTKILVDEDKEDGMTDTQIKAYSVGHFNNDICAAQWFNYFTWYINKVVGLSPQLTGLCCLSG